MQKDKEKLSLFERELVNEALKQSFVKLNPRIMYPQPGNVYGRNRNSGHAVRMNLYQHATGETSQGSLGITSSYS